VRLTNVVFLNAALYHGVFTPPPCPKAAGKPTRGTRSGQGGNGAPFTRTLAAVVFCFPSPISRDRTRLLACIQAAELRAAHPPPAAIHPERDQHHARWRQRWTAHCAAQLHMGMRDPVSGPPVAEVIKTAFTDCTPAALDDVGHYPSSKHPSAYARR